MDILNNIHVLPGSAIQNLSWNWDGRLQEITM